MGGDSHDVIIIGAGVAGISLSYFLTERGVTDILILERESQPAYHATGRSAAVLVELDTIPALHQLKVRSAGFFRDPPSGFSEYPLLQQSGALLLFGGPMWDMLRQAAQSLGEMGTRLELLSPAEAVARVPVLSEEHFEGAVLLPEDGQMDVHQLLQSYTHHARKRGAVQQLNTEVEAIRVENGRSVGVETRAGAFRARWIVNAAGAWAGKPGDMAGCAGINQAGTEAAILVGNLRCEEKDLQLSIERMPWQGDVQWEIFRLDSRHDLECVRSGRASVEEIRLTESVEAPCVLLVRLHKTLTPP